MIWIVIILACLGYLLQPWLWKFVNKGRNPLPPGPRGLPILGNLHMLGAYPHRDLHQLAQKYGSIMFLRLGFVPTIVVSSPEAAELFLKTYDLVFASRPMLEAVKYMFWEQKSMTFAKYGSYWRNTRKMCTLELLNSFKINSFRAMRKEELDLLIGILREAARDRVAVDVSAKVAALSADMSCRMILGKKYGLKEKCFKALMQEGGQLAATPNFADYIPYVGVFDLQGLTRRMKEVSRIFDDFFEKIIDEHKQSEYRQGNIKDFVDVMLRFDGIVESDYRIERTNIKAILLDMLAGSMDTSSTAIEWTLSELIKHPRVMKKVQKELEEVVGMEKKVEESDLERLEYLNMVIKESLRIHPVAPLLLPHQSVEDCMVGNLFIPKNSRIIVNAWAIMRDPNAWSDPEKFWPERFEGSSIDMRGRDFQFIPFGAGRRGCPGIQLGLLVVHLVVAQLVHCFDWELPDNMLPPELDMTEVLGLTMPRAKHLVAIPTSYRLHK